VSGAEKSLEGYKACERDKQLASEKQSVFNDIVHLVSAPQEKSDVFAQEMSSLLVTFASEACRMYAYAMLCPTQTIYNADTVTNISSTLSSVTNLISQDVTKKWAQTKEFQNFKDDAEALVTLAKGEGDDGWLRTLQEKTVYPLLDKIVHDFVLPRSCQLRNLIINLNDDISSHQTIYVFTLQSLWNVKDTEQAQQTVEALIDDIFQDIEIPVPRSDGCYFAFVEHITGTDFIVLVLFELPYSPVGQAR